MSFSDKIISFNNNHKIASHILFWFLLLLVQLSSSSYYNSDQVPFRNNLVGDGTNLLAQIPAAYFVAYFVVPRLVYKQKYFAAFAAFSIGSYIICVLSRIGVIYFEEPFYGRQHKPGETFIEILTDIPKLVYVYFFRIFSVAFIFMILKLLKDQQMVQKRTLLLKKEKVESELKLLKTQLNPHFLFNTLNNIYSLSLSNSPVTSASIARLSEILDYILYRCNSTFVPLSAEVNLLDNYIGLEKLRYDNRLKVNFKITQQHDIQIAPLILLTIVENAFKHGAGNDAGNPEINIELYADNSQFRFTVVNSVYQKKNMNNNGNIGLSNLKQQLDLLYHGKHDIKTTHTDALFTVNLNISLL